MIKKMILNEFIKDAEKNQMIAAILKDHKVKVRVIHKPIKDYAYYVLGKGVLEISNKKGVIRNEKDFLITVLHETWHAVQATKIGWRKFKDMWEYEANMISGGHYEGKTHPYDDNPHEIEAEEFGQKNWKQWYNKFKKQNLI